MYLFGLYIVKQCLLNNITDRKYFTRFILRSVKKMCVHKYAGVYVLIYFAVYYIDRDLLSYTVHTKISALQAEEFLNCCKN